jgi:glycosyltransferase involved in cell wall biosynthesis
MPPEEFVIDGVADVSIIVPAWRAAATIDRALASIAAQTIPPREVIVVDDGSDDGTSDAAEAAARRFARSRFELIRSPHQGAGAARNAALRRTSATFVAFLDADDEWLPAKIERSLAHVNGGDVVLVSHDYAFVAGKRETAVDCARHFQAARNPATALFVRNFIATSTVLARRDAVRAAGGFDPGLPSGQDYDLWLAMLLAPEARFCVFPESLARCHATPGSISSRSRERLRCAMAILKRYAPHLRARASSPGVVLLARALVVHYEAATAFLGRNDWVAAAQAALAVPLALLDTARAAQAPLWIRPDFLESRLPA